MKLTIREIAYAGMGAGLITLCSWLSIPMTVPITLQTFAVCLVTALFGLKLGLVTVAAYLLLGAAGVPVFSGFRGGIGALLGVTGGYLVGFLFTALKLKIPRARSQRGRRKAYDRQGTDHSALQGDVHRNGEEGQSRAGTCPR